MFVRQAVRLLFVSHQYQIQKVFAFVLVVLSFVTPKLALSVVSKIVFPFTFNCKTHVGRPVTCVCTQSKSSTLTAQRYLHVPYCIRIEVCLGPLGLCVLGRLS